MKTRTDNNGVYTISKPMMNCFKQLLFSANGSVDLQGIVNDLTFGQNDDLMACAVAFAYKGIKPEIDKALRFEYGYRCYYTYEVIDYSMILDGYKCVKSRYNWDKETKSFVAREETEEAMFSAVFINSLSTKLDISRVSGIIEEQ